MTDNDKRDALFIRLNNALQAQLGVLTAERQAAIEKMEALGARTDAAALNILLDYLTQTDNELLPSLAASRLGEIGNPQVMERVTALLQHSADKDRRALAAQILGDIGADAAVVPLSAALAGDDSDAVRVRCAMALGKLGNQDAVGSLSEAMQRDPSRDVRNHSIEALGELGDAAVVDLLAAMVYDEDDKETRTYAVEALGKIGTEAAVTHLIDALNDRQLPAIVRYYAAYALGLAGNSRGIPALQEATRDPHDWIAQMAQDSLARLQGDQDES